MPSPPPPSSPTIEARHAQAHPQLEPEDAEHMRRFGTVRKFSAGEVIFETGKPAGGLYLVLSGTIRITGRDGHGHDVVVVDHHERRFAGELGSLSARPALVDGVALVDSEVLVIDPERLRGLLIAEATLGEKIMRALILRRVGLIESGFGGPVLVGGAEHHDVVRLRNFLTRNGIPHILLDPADDEDARAFVERYATTATDLPLVICPDGTVLRRPSEEQVAQHIGMIDEAAGDITYDVAITGAGPAGLAAAVYAASEGLSVLVIDQRAFGGQAGASARIENYLGFPTGISGQALAGRAYTQAQKFGARVMIPTEVKALQCHGGPGEPLALQLADDRVVQARTIVIASGARYRRFDDEALRRMEGHGIWFWASPIEARMCVDEEVVLVGGGNSAGQGAVFLAAHAKKVWMLVRGKGLADSMSRYLIDRIEATANIELVTRSEVVAVDGTPESGIRTTTWRNRDTQEATTRPVRNIFLFLGAEPATEWLENCNVATDDRGFVATGSDPQLPLCTSVPGVFAIGDVRSGSVKRVGGAIGEGASVVAQIHAFLAARRDAGVAAAARSA